MVITKIQKKRPTQAFLSEHNDVVQAFPAYRSAYAFDVSPLPGRSRCAEDFVDVHDFELLAEFVSVDPIAISQEILWCAAKGEGLDDLLTGPLRCRMDRHVEMKDAAAVVREYDKHK